MGALREAKNRKNRLELLAQRAQHSKPGSNRGRQAGDDWNDEEPDKYCRVYTEGGDKGFIGHASPGCERQCTNDKKGGDKAYTGTTKTKHEKPPLDFARDKFICCAHEMENGDDFFIGGKACAGSEN